MEQAKLMTTIDDSIEKITDLIEEILKEQAGEFEVKYGHLSENGYHIEIEGAKEKLILIELALASRGHTALVL